MEKLEYFFQLIERVSAPAKAIDKALGGVNKALDEADAGLKTVEKAAKELETQLRDLEVQAKKTRLEKTTDPMKRQRLELQLNRIALRNQREAAMQSANAIRQQKRAMEQATKAQAGYTLGTDLLSNGIQSAISAVAGLAVRTVELGVAGAKFATDAIAFKEQTLTALKVMTGTEQSAQRIFNEALQFAKRTPFDTRDVLGGFTQLLGAGFKENEVATVFAAIGDAAAASGFDQQVIDRMVTAFAQIRAKGRLMGGEMLQVNEALGKAGVGTTAIYDQIAKRMGKTRAEVIKLQEAGGIDADSAIFGIIKALEQKSGGAVGNLMAQQSKTLKGLLSTLASAPGDFFMSLDLSKLPGFDALKGFVGNMVKLFDTGSKAGQRMQDVVGKLYNTVMSTLFGDLGSASGLARMESFALRVSQVVEDSLPALRNFLSLLKGFGSGLASGLLASLERMSAVQKVLADGPEAAEAARQLGESIGKLASNLFRAAEAVLFIMRPIIWLQETFGGGGKPLLDPASASQQGFSWGAALTAGLRNGIIQNLTGPTSATDMMVAAIKSGYQAGTETHSPSRLFARYGAWATEGWALGLESGIPGAEAAVARMVDASSGAELELAPSVGAGGGFAGGRSITVNVTVPLQVDGGAGEDGESFGERVRDFLVRELPGALEQAFTQVATQAGG